MNGQPHDEASDVFEHEMELDDQMNDGEDWDRMDTEEGDNSMKYQEMLQETIEYGQQLKLEYRDDGRREVKKALEDTFSLIAYSDPKSSVHSHLLEPSGRVPVAEELNSAILGESACSCLILTANILQSLLANPPPPHSNAYINRPKFSSTRSAKKVALARSSVSGMIFSTNAPLVLHTCRTFRQR